jgi:hypothetical protein
MPRRLISGAVALVFALWISVLSSAQAPGKAQVEAPKNTSNTPATRACQIQNTYFNAICMIRGSEALRILPKVGLLKLISGHEMAGTMP